LYSIESIIAFSTAPLALASVLGIILFIMAIAFIIFIIVRTLYFGDPTSGWPSLVCIVLLISGIQLLCIGIIGQYLAKTYLEAKRRPLYIIKEKNTDKKKNSESENS
jgi:glycosyltransferase involved in cell wall biosynthesis